MKKASLLFALLLAGTTSHLSASGLLTNGDFETGDFTGWNFFTTSNGIVLGDAFGAAAYTGGTVVSFDTSGSGASLSGVFDAGQLLFNRGFQEGGGITQTFHLNTASVVDFDASVAAYAVTENNAAGVFSILVDSTNYATLDLGVILSGATLRSSLSTSVALSAGDHTLGILITRPFLQLPNQFLDNITAVAETAQSAPEPGTLALFGAAAALIGIGRTRRRKSS